MRSANIGEQLSQQPSLRREWRTEKGRVLDSLQQRRRFRGFLAPCEFRAYDRT